MKTIRLERRVRKTSYSFMLGIALLLAAAHPAVAAEPALQIGDRAPHFSVATNQDTLADYDRDYYGSHHLVLTFFPAAFTPV